MKRFALAGALLVAAFAGVILAQDKALKELEGTYKVTHLEKVGKVASKDVTDSMKLTFKDDELLIKVADEEKRAKIKVDASKTPNTIDVIPAEGPEKGKTFPGIYKIEKGELIINFTEKGDRPKEFKVEGEALLMKMKKEEKK